MSNRLSCLAFSLVAGLCAAAAGAYADTLGNGQAQVTAQAFQPVPADATLAIEPRDDSDANLRLGDRLKARLSERHHAVAAGAPWRLRFSTETVSSAGLRPGTSTGDMTVTRDRQSFTPSNLGYSEADRFFGGPTERPGGAGQTSYRVTATLETRDGRVLWRGQATGALAERDETRIAQSLIDALADSLSDTIEHGTKTADAPSSPAPGAPAATSLGAVRLPFLPELAERR